MTSCLPGTRITSVRGISISNWNNPDRWNTSERLWKTLSTGSVEYGYKRSVVNTRAFTLDFDENGKRYELGLDEISDGQRALVALYSLVHLSAGLGYTLFLDEPENYVALPEIEPWLAELSDRCGDAIPQAVICSHHPELIDYLGLSSGISLSREPSGVTRATRIEDLSLTTAEGGLKLSEIVARGWDR